MDKGDCFTTKYGWFNRARCQHKIKWIMQVGVKCGRLLGKYRVLYDKYSLVRRRMMVLGVQCNGMFQVECCASYLS